MAKARYVVFGPFCLDVADERLWKDGESLPLGRKALAVLTALVGHPDQLVTKEALLAAAWPDIAVSEAVLTTAVREIRVAIADPARAPRFVQTVHGRGYRFIAPVESTEDDPRARGSRGDASARFPRAAAAGGDGQRVLVGRDVEWNELGEWFGAVRRGTPRIGFVAGEAGIGKTALIDAFTADLATAGGVRVGRGQCIEHFGVGEAYLPILEALGRLARDPAVPLAHVLRDHAPDWLPHLPPLAGLSADPSSQVRPARMLRELTDALVVLAVDAPLVLVLEDLHWSDSATLDWLASVARRRDNGSLFVLGTYRPVEALLNRSPLREVLAGLRHQPHTREIVLDFLPRAAVGEYVRRRFGRRSNLEELVDVLYSRTGGHPLFLDSIADELLQLDPHELTSGELRAKAHAIPTSVRQFIEHRFEQLSNVDVTILEAASVAGDPFSVAAVAAGTSLPAELIEAHSSALAGTHHLLEADGVVAWPDGTVEARYRFRHALFQETAYARISSERRARLHLLIGRRLEAAYTTGASIIAAELALHFEQGRNLATAVSYLKRASWNAVRRSAYTEAHRHLVHALTLLDALPAGPVRADREATLSLLLAQVLESTKGWGAADVAHAYSRARDACIVLGDDDRLLQATWGLVAGGCVRAELRQARALSYDMLALARKRRNTLFRMAGHFELGGIALMLGQAAVARRHFGLAETLYDPDEHPRSVAACGVDLGIFARIWASHLMWYEGHPDRARARAADTLETAAAIDHPFTRTLTLAYAGMLAQFLRDAPEVDRLTDAAIAHAVEHGFSYYLAWAEVLRAWSRAMKRGGDSDLADMRRGIETMQATAGLRLPYYRALLAEVCGRCGRPEEGLRALASAHDAIRGTGERWWAAELHRIEGELLVLAPTTACGDAETCFRTAIDVARRQGALMLGVAGGHRSGASMARPGQIEGREAPARENLQPVR